MIGINSDLRPITTPRKRRVKTQIIVTDARRPITRGIKSRTKIATETDDTDQLKKDGAIMDKRTTIISSSPPPSLKPNVTINRLSPLTKPVAAVSAQASSSTNNKV